MGGTRSGARCGRAVEDAKPPEGHAEQTDLREGVHRCLEYGIGLPTKQAQDGGHSTVVIRPQYPLGTDPEVMKRLR